MSTVSQSNQQAPAPTNEISHRTTRMWMQATTRGALVKVIIIATVIGPDVHAKREEICERKNEGE